MRKKSHATLAGLLIIYVWIGAVECDETFSATVDLTNSFGVAFGLDPNHIDIFLRSNTNAVSQVVLQAGTYSYYPDTLAGNIIAGPSTVVAYSNREKAQTISVFVVGVDNYIYRRKFSPATGWTPPNNDWMRIGVGTTLAPAVVSRGDGRIDLFVVSVITDSTTNGTSIH